TRFSRDWSSDVCSSDLNSRPIAVERRDGPTQIEVAIQYNDSFSETVLAFANNINTVDGGTHVTGFRAALTSSLNDWARRQGIIKIGRASCRERVYIAVS